MSTETSIGPEGDRGGNENVGNADGCGNKTLGDKATQQPAAGAERAIERAGADTGGARKSGERAGAEGDDASSGAESVLEHAGAEVPAGVPGARPRAGIAKGPSSYPDGPNVEDSPWELDAARGELPKER